MMQISEDKIIAKFEGRTNADASFELSSHSYKWRLREMIAIILLDHLQIIGLGC